MTTLAVASAAEFGALALMAAALACACGAATARSLFAMCMYVAAAAALASATMLALGAGSAALGVALFGVGLAPVMVLAALLLSARAVKPKRRGLAWVTIAAAIAVAGAMLWASPELAHTRPAPIVPELNVSALLALLLFPAIAAVVALLGYGERGALERTLHLERGQ